MVFGDLRGVYLTLLHCFGQFPRGIGNFGPATIIDRQIERNARVLSRNFHVPVHFAQKRGGQPFSAAHKTDSDAVLVQLAQLSPGGVFDQIHQPVGLVPGPPPVFIGENVQRQHFDVEFGGIADNSPSKC